MKKLSEHSEKCCIQGTDQEYWTFDKTYFGDFRGSISKRGNFHIWLQFRCNDPDCMQKIIIDEKELQDWIKEVV